MGPVVLPLGAEDPQEFLDFLIHAFDLAVSFRMVGRREAGFDAAETVEFSHISGRELRASIRENFLRETMKTEHVPVMDICSAFCCQIRLAGH